jgi:hypothetical protein
MLQLCMTHIKSRPDGHLAFSAEAKVDEKLGDEFK